MERNSAIDRDNEIHLIIVTFLNIYTVVIIITHLEHSLSGHEAYIFRILCLTHGLLTDGLLPVQVTASSSNRRPTINGHVYSEARPDRSLYNMPTYDSPSRHIDIYFVGFLKLIFCCCLRDSVWLFRRVTFVCCFL